MEIEIKYKLSAGKNADEKYSFRNKYKSKIKGLDKAVDITTKKLNSLEKDIKETKQNIHIKKKEIKLNKKWYSKFRWFFTSNGFLVIGGRDSKNNEVLVKKHMEEKDLYYHADVHGAPHVVLKNPIGKEVPLEDKQEAAQFAAIYSSAWKNKIFSIDVYSVTPEQVSKTANAGESLGTGAFVIRGKREYFRKQEPKIALSYCKVKGVIAGPESAIKTQVKDYFIITPGDTKKSDISKELKLRIMKWKISVSVEDLESALPPGNSKIDN